MEPAPPLRVLLVDDEPHARKTLRLLLEPDPGIEIVGECENGLEALESIRAERPDLVFLDIQMPELDGFGVIELLEEPVPMFLFVTAYDQYALRAFDSNALDYLVKPFSNERFERALAKARQQFGTFGRRDPGLAALTAATRLHRHRFIVRTPGRIVFLRSEEIDWIEASDYYACLHVGNRSYLLRESMNDLEASLDPAAFARIHRSAIVNLDRVLELLNPANGDPAVRLRGGTIVRMSRTRREALTEKMARLV